MATSDSLTAAETRGSPPLFGQRLGIGLAAAAGTVGLAFLARYGLEPWLGERAPLILFTLPVLFCSLYLGRGPAALASLLGLGVGVVEFTDNDRLNTSDGVHLGTFALVCAGIVFLADRVLRARRSEASENERAARSADEVSGLVAELERRERHLRSILETVPDAMIIIDERGNIVSFSAAAEAMFGYTEAELLGENVSVLMPSPDRERHDGYMERYGRTGERRIIGIGRVTNARRRDGSNFPIHLHVGETRAGGQRLFTGFIEDLTERQETLHRLSDLQSELAHVSRVTAMGTLATSLAHELNQPLTAIANYVETARDLLDEPNPETVEIVREALDECATQSVRAGQIVRRLRDFISRGETERRVESLSRLISEASALALVGAGERGIEVDVKLGRGTDKVLVDRIQIQQVLLNLIRNAVEAMNGCPTRRLEISSRKAEDGFTEVIIADSGPGLPQEVGERLFEPFVSTKSAGMGLGLSICHTIVTGHGGRIWAEPSSFGGTAFHFTLMDARDESDEQ
jgi:two-component system, LuxR family, sensor kinase FixL